MTEYRIEFNESQVSSMHLPGRVLSMLGRVGELRTVIKGVRYYLVTNKKVEKMCEYLNRQSGVSVARLQGNLLRDSP
jgi:hypothetical protein